MVSNLSFLKPRFNASLIYNNYISTLDLCLEMDSSWPILCGAEIHGLEFQFCQKTPKTVLLLTQQPNIAQRLFCFQNKRQDILSHLI